MESFFLELACQQKREDRRDEYQSPFVAFNPHWGQQQLRRLRSKCGPAEHVCSISPNPEHGCVPSNRQRAQDSSIEVLLSPFSGLSNGP
jgi:hypothetical protein